MELKPRDVQTQVKHKILEKYLGTWGGIILNGLKGLAAHHKQWYGKQLEHHFVYVDCFAYLGRYAGNTEDFFLERVTGPVPGSPIIGIRTIDRLVTMACRYDIDLSVNTILVEKDPDNYTGLLETLSTEGLAQRVKQTTDFSSLTPGEIAVVHGDTTQIADKLLSYTRERYTKAFYLIDPWGPSGIPHDFVQSIIRSEGHDVMINFPYYDLDKKAGSIDTPHHQGHINYWTKAFGCKDWIRIVREIEEKRASRDALLAALGMTVSEAEGDPLFEALQQDKSSTDRQLTELKERRLFELYRTVLLEMDPTLAVKTIRLRFPDKERPMFYLFLTTHDPTGALALNKILSDAKLREYELRYIRRSAKRQRPPEGQLSFLKPVEPEVPEPKMVDRASVEDCAEDIMRRFSGKAATRRDVYRELADEEYFDTEVNSAISRLKKERRATYRGTLSHDTLIQFSKH
jgi:three-Cys-motif partner protein